MGGTAQSFFEIVSMAMRSVEWIFFSCHHEVDIAHAESCAIEANQKLAALCVSLDQLQNLQCSSSSSCPKLTWLWDIHLLHFDLELWTLIHTHASQALLRNLLSSHFAGDRFDMVARYRNRESSWETANSWDYLSYNNGRRPTTRPLLLRRLSSRHAALGLPFVCTAHSVGHIWRIWAGLDS